MNVACVPRSVIAALVVTAGAAACADDPPPVVTPDQYRTELAAICTSTDARLTAMDEPPETADVAVFANTVGAALGDEADRARELAVPDELDDDHRAFVRNTDEQSAAWGDLAVTAPDDPTFGDLARQIGELTLGRNDLAAEMGVEACVRSTAEP